MADNGYDEPGTKQQGTSKNGSSSSSTPSKFSNSTTGGGSSFSRGDNLDPVRRGEGGLWKPHGDSTGSAGGGAKDSTPGSEGGASDKAGKSSGGGATDSTGSAGGGASDSTGGTAGGASDNTGTPSEGSDEEDSGLFEGSSKGKSNSTSRFKARFKMSPKQAAIGGGAIAGIAGLGVAGFLLLLPLKIEHIVSNLENHFSATSNSAVESETQTLLESYIATRVLPGYKSCGTTIKRGCNALSFGTGPVSALYTTWAQARLENTLYEKYHIEFFSESKSNVWRVRYPGSSKEGDRVDQVFNGKTEARKGFKAQLKIAMADETLWKKVLIRYKAGRLWSTKYGTKRCIIFCGTKKKVAGQKLAAKLYLTQRVITPRTATLGIALQCLFAGDSCKTTNTQPDADPNAPGENGGPGNPDTDVKISDGMREFAKNFGLVDDVSLKALQDTYNKISDQGFQKYLITEGLQKVGVNAAVAGTTADAIPIAGWINMAAQVVTASQHAGPNLRKLRYVVNGTAAVDLFMMYRTYADEIHTGNVSPTEVGSFASSLGPGNSGNPNDPELGGTADATSTPLYQSLIDGTSSSSSTSTSLLDEVLPQRAYAASPTSTSASSSDYVCNDGKPVPAGKLICPEESLGGVNSFADTLSSIVGTGGVLTTLAAAWNSTIGRAFSLANGIIGGAFGALSSALDLQCSILPIGVLPPGYCLARDEVKAGIKTIIDAVTKWLIPDPFSTNMSGGRTFDEMAAGADVAYNDEAHTVIGGKKLSSQQVADITNQQETEAKQQFSHQSFFARMFSTDSQYSLVTKIAMDMPLNLRSATETDFAALVSNPLGFFAHGFASVISGNANADTQAQDDPFGVTQYGYTSADLAAIGDPGKYWDKNCVDDASQGYQQSNKWNIDASQPQNVDPSTGMPLNNATNPCILIKASVGAAGGMMDTSNLTQDDLAEVNGGSGSSGSTSPTTTPVSGDAQQLAQQILSSNKVTFSGRLVKSDLQATVAGKPASAGAPISSALLKLIATISQSHSVDISAIESGGSGHATGSYHYTGDAVDFDSLDGTSITGRNAPALTIIQIATGVLPSGSAFGQAQCGSTPTLPSGFSTFDDTCNHLHVQVARGTP